MAKEQNLSLNPTKISGVCGRLMCCLKNEQETYEYLNSRMPSVGDMVTTPSGMTGKVSVVNILRQTVKVVVDTGEEREQQEYSVDEIKFTPRRRKDVKLTEEEIKELEGLEDQESVDEDNETRSRRNEETVENGESAERPAKGGRRSGRSRRYNKGSKEKHNKDGNTNS
jgi:preprotein translocase subunit YajC